MNNCNVKIKICGVRDVSTALQAIDHGADYIGIMCYKKSKRYIGAEKVVVPLTTTVPCVSILL